MNFSTGNEPKPVKAAKCALNPGIVDLAGNQTDHLERIWDNDTLIAAIGIMGMKMKLAAVIEEIYGVIGQV